MKAFSEKLIGKDVRHNTRGPGRISDIQLRENRMIICVQHEGHTMANEYSLADIEKQFCVAPDLMVIFRELSTRLATSISSEKANNLSSLLEEHYKERYKCFAEKVSAIDSSYRIQKRRDKLSIIRKKIDDAYAPEEIADLCSKKCPYAISYYCSSKRSWYNNLSKDYPQQVLNLFRTNGDTPKCSLDDLWMKVTQLVKESKKSIAQAEYSKFYDAWEEERFRIFCGTDDGLYDEFTTWPFVRDNILPIATPDIWDSLSLFFENYVSSTDKKEFSKAREEYRISTVVDTKPVPNNSTSKVSFSEYSVVCDKLCAEGKTKELLYHTKSGPKLHRLYSSCLLLSTLRTTMKPKEMESVVHLIEGATKKDSISFLKAVRNGTKHDIACVLNESIPPEKWTPWIEAVKELFPTYIGSPDVGIWIFLLDKLNILSQYSDDLNFWIGLKSGIAKDLIHGFKDVLPFEKFMAFSWDICAHAKCSGSEYIGLYRIWRNSILTFLLEIEEFSTSLSCFRDFLDTLYSPEDSRQDMLEVLFEKARTILNTQTNNHWTNQATSTEQTPEQLVAAMKSFIDLESTIMRQINGKPAERGSYRDIQKKLMQIRDDLKYFAEHNYNAKIEPVASVQDYLSGTPIPYDAELHLSSEYLPPKTNVLILSLGIMLNGEVKYKARVQRYTLQ